MPVRKTPAAAAAAPVAAAAVDLAIPPQLLQHLRERRLLLFAGAGLSAQAGLPTWRSLVQDVVDATIAEAMQGEESRRELEGMIAAGKWLQIADHCKLKLGPGEYARLLGEQLGDFGKPVPEAHRLAVRLPFAAWVTTNYDKLLERAYAEERGGLPKTLTSLDTEALGRLLFDGAPFVLKAALPLTHSVLFVGYSLADPDFNLLLDRQLLTFRGFAPERYALMSGIGKVEEEYLWRVCQIRVIPYPGGQHEAVPAFFQRLADRLDPADVAPAARVARAVTVGVAPPALRAAHATRAGPAPVAVATPASLALDWREGAVQAILSDGGKVIATAAGPREAWATPAAASRSLQSASARDVSLAECSGALTRTLGAATVKALARVLKGQGSRLLRLDLTREVERLPWELLALGSQTLAEMAAVFRAPGGVSEHARTAGGRFAAARTGRRRHGERPAGSGSAGRGRRGDRRGRRNPRQRCRRLPRHLQRRDRRLRRPRLRRRGLSRAAARRDRRRRAAVCPQPRRRARKCYRAAVLPLRRRRTAARRWGPGGLRGCPEIVASRPRCTA